MAVALVLFFCVGLFFYVGKRSIASFLSLIIIISLIFYCAISDQNLFDASHLLHALWVILTIGAIVLPWKEFKNIKVIEGYDLKKTDSVSRVLIITCLALVAFCIIISFFVLSYISDINQYKYTDGTQDFYSSLDMDLHALTLAVLLYPLGYVLIPFVFYYMAQKRLKRSLLCFLGSLLPIVYGLTYFSRAHIVHFILIYLAAYLLLKDTIDINYKNSLKKVLVVLGIASAALFVSISINRFNDNVYMRSSGEIESKNAAWVSSLDYVSMWWPNSQLLFERFEGETLGNEILFQQIHKFFYITTFGVVKNNADIIANDRQLLLKEKSNSFIGVSGYTLYDQGPILGIFLYLLYGFFVRKQKPKNGKISIGSLMLVFILIQYPLYSIFYSVMDNILLSLMYMIPVFMYMRKTKKLK